MRQYRDGAEFCRQVIAEVGMPGLNAVWTSPETLPTRAEIAQPSLWLARVHPDPWSGLSLRGALFAPRSMARRALGPATLAAVQAVERVLVTDDRALLVACSGGADSTALAVAALEVGRRRRTARERGRRRSRFAG